jgi:hypothetical protein
MNEFEALDNRFYNPTSIHVPNLPIEFVGKLFLIDFSTMTSISYYNILHGHDYIYVINAMVYSLFHVMKFPNVGTIVTIDWVKYCDPSQCPTPNILTHSITHIDPMNYVTTSITYATLAPVECEPIDLETPPHHFDLEVGYICSPLGVSNLVHKCNKESQPMVWIAWCK